MKTYPISMCLTLAAGIALIVVVTAIAQKPRAGVSIHETSVKIHPGTKISGDDQKKLDDVLKKFDGSLYKIRRYDRGRLVKEQGSLADVRIDQTLLAGTNRAVKEGISEFALQFGWGFHYVHVGNNPTPSPPPGSTSITAQIRGLRSRVAPILQKYGQ